MKKTITTLLLLSCITAFSFAQSIVMTSGTIDFIKDQQVIQFTFSYDEMLVGKLTENEYVEKRVLNTTLKKRAKETNGKPPGMVTVKNGLNQSSWSFLINT